VLAPGDSDALAGALGDSAALMLGSSYALALGVAALGVAQVPTPAW
jgi:hypothetical protein